MGLSPSVWTLLFNPPLLSTGPEPILCELTSLVWVSLVHSPKNEPQVTLGTGTSWYGMWAASTCLLWTCSICASPCPSNYSIFMMLGKFFGGTPERCHPGPTLQVTSFVAVPRQITRRPSLCLPISSWLGPPYLSFGLFLLLHPLV